MKKILLSTALSLVIATSALAAGHGNMFQEIEVQPRDMAASRLLGKSVYITEKMVMESEMFSTEARADWERVGEINELVISGDGQVKAVVVGVGGFLGMGERDVAVTFDQIKRVKEDDASMSEYFLVLQGNAKILAKAPEFTRLDDVRQQAREKIEEAMEEKAAKTDQMVGLITDSRQMLRRPKQARQAFRAQRVSTLTAEQLEGARIISERDEDIGEVSEILLNGDGKIEGLVLDIGGFLGLGEHQILVSMDEVLIQADEDNQLFVGVDATQEELEAQPEYEVN